MREFIFGTDWGGDCDDCVALRVISRFVKADKAKLLGIVINDNIDYSVSSMEEFLRLEGLKNIPLGIDKSGAVFGSHPTYQKRLGKYTSNEACEDGVRTYRRLVAQANGKVEIIEVGFLHVLNAFLESHSDDISPLTGYELMQSKVERIWSMAGSWHEAGGREYNICCGEASALGAKNLFEKCPVPITFLGWEIGHDVITGTTLDKNDYLYQALCDWGASEGRPSWDPMTALLALTGDIDKAGYTGVTGYASVKDSYGQNYFKEDINGPHTYVKRKFDVSYYANLIDEIIE
ncbi:MAG: hypothetical protein IJW54_01765 [Clostridia bacterium]|nr:hypothetical protein [Clostridia bacterium]